MTSGSGIADGVGFGLGVVEGFGFGVVEGFGLGVVDGFGFGFSVVDGLTLFISIGSGTAICFFLIFVPVGGGGGGRGPVGNATTTSPSLFFVSFALFFLIAFFRTAGAIIVGAIKGGGKSGFKYGAVGGFFYLVVFWLLRARLFLNFYPVSSLMQALTLVRLFARGW